MATNEKEGLSSALKYGGPSALELLAREVELINDHFDEPAGFVHAELVVGRGHEAGGAAFSLQVGDRDFAMGLDGQFFGSGSAVGSSRRWHPVQAWSGDGAHGAGGAFTACRETDAGGVSWGPNRGLMQHQADHVISVFDEPFFPSGYVRAQLDGARFSLWIGDTLLVMGSRGELLESRMLEGVGRKWADPERRPPTKRRRARRVVGGNGKLAEYDGNGSDK